MPLSASVSLLPACVATVLIVSVLVCSLLSALLYYAQLCFNWNLTYTTKVGTVEIKPVFCFLLTGAHCCLSFRGRRAPEKPQWLASHLWDRIAFQDLLRQHQTGHLSHNSTSLPRTHTARKQAHISVSLSIYMCVCVWLTVHKQAKTNRDVQVMQKGCTCGI